MKTIILRSVNKDMTAYGGFVWPKAGQVEAPDWEPTAECGHGLHGLRSGDNNPGTWYKNGLVLGVEVEAKDIIDLGGKCKFKSGRVVYCGDMTGFCANFPGVWFMGTATAGNYGTATAGDGGIIQVGYYDVKRYRICVGYVGEKGVLPDTPYRVENGKLVAVKIKKEPSHE